MSVEFVEPEPVPPAPVDLARDPEAERGRAWPWRVLGVVGALGGVALAVASRSTVYTVDRSAVVVDFDSTTVTTTTIPVAADGIAPPTVVAPLTGRAQADITQRIEILRGLDLAPWWLGIGIVLVVLGLWMVLRPRSTRGPGLLVAGGAAAAGSVGVLVLYLRSLPAQLSAPQIPFTTAPAAGLWLALAGAGAALLAGLARLVVPRPPG